MTPPARVLWLIKGLGPGGAERLLATAARHVDRDQFDMEVAYLLPQKDQLASELRDAGVKVELVPGGRSLWSPMWIARLRSLLKSGRYDLVHAHLPVAGIGARLAARSLGRGRPAIVYTEHNSWSRYHPVTRAANAATFGLNDAAIAVSRSVALSMSAGARKKTTVVPNGIDIDDVKAGALSRSEARRELGLSEDAGEIVVGTVGGITPKKGHRELVRSAAQVVREVPGTRFVFVGLPADDGPVRAEIAAAGLEESVLLAGYRPDAARLMPAFDIYCLPSLVEGMPLSLLEAMALGICCVVTSAGGITEVVTDGEDALVVAPGDSSTLAGALRRVIENGDVRRRLGNAAVQTAARFDIGSVVRSTEQVYRTVLEKSR